MCLKKKRPRRVEEDGYICSEGREKQYVVEQNDFLGGLNVIYMKKCVCVLCYGACKKCRVIFRRGVKKDCSLLML